MSCDGALWRDGGCVRHHSSQLNPLTELPLLCPGMVMVFLYLVSTRYQQGFLFSVSIYAYVAAFRACLPQGPQVLGETLNDLYFETYISQRTWICKVSHVKPMGSRMATSLYL